MANVANLRFNKSKKILQIFCFLLFSSSSMVCFSDSTVTDLTNILFPGESLLVSESILSGNNALVLQADGNLVLYNVSGWSLRATWATNTSGRSVSTLIMQPDGNLVLYDSNWAPIFASNTNGWNGAYLKVQDDGNLVIYQFGSNGTWGAIWSTETSGNY